MSVTLGIVRRARRGAPRTPEYAAWLDMLARCERPTHKRFRYYGARGIRVCAGWRGEGGFERFLRDVGRRPSDAHSIDRIDNEGPYEATNVRWATQTEQVRNRRSTVRLTINGVTKPLAEWLEQTGLSYQAAVSRLARGCDPSVAVGLAPFTSRTSDNVRTRRVTIDGTTRALCDWVRDTGVPYGTAKTRLDRGWDPARAVGIR